LTDSTINKAGNCVNGKQGPRIIVCTNIFSLRNLSFLTQNPRNRTSQSELFKETKRIGLSSWDRSALSCRETYMLEKISLHQLSQALQVKEQLERLQSELSQILGGTSSQARQPGPGRGRGMSAAGRARIAAAQRARWAKHKNSVNVSGAKPQQKRRKMSAAGRAKIAAAARARWKKAKAAGKKSL